MLRPSIRLLQESLTVRSQHQHFCHIVTYLSVCSALLLFVAVTCVLASVISRNTIIPGQTHICRPFHCMCIQTQKAMKCGMLFLLVLLFTIYRSEEVWISCNSSDSSTLQLTADIFYV